MHQAPACQKQNSLRFIKKKYTLEGAEAWVTSGGSFYNCMLAAAQQHWQQFFFLFLFFFFFQSEVKVLINEEQNGAKWNEKMMRANAIKRGAN